MVRTNIEARATALLRQKFTAPDLITRFKLMNIMKKLDYIAPLFVIAHQAATLESKNALA